MDPGGYAGGGSGAFGGGKAGAAQDPLNFLKKPVVMIRLSALLFGIIVFGSISSQGWSHDHSLGKEICVLNNSSATCHFATFVGVMAFIAALGFLVGEWYFEQMSSIKTRKHYVIGDMGFSALWAAFYAIAFLVMCIAWSKTPEKYAYASANVIGAIFFAFFSIFSWGGAAYLAYQRFQAGADAAFSQGLGADDEGFGHQGDYGDDEESGPRYSDPPFSGGQTGMNYQQQLQY